MTDSLDCQWIENHLEALFCDRLEPEEDRLARAHIENCPSCLREVQALKAIDPLVKNHFQRELRAAQQPRVAHAGRVFGVSAAALALVAILMFVVLRTPQTVPVQQPVSTNVQAPAVAAIEPSVTPKTNEAPANAVVERTKPNDIAGRIVDQAAKAPAPASVNAPELLITDPAGYSHKLEDFHGHVVVLTVWSSASPDAVANFERLYRAHGSDPRFRFLGVSDQRVSKPANITFPIFYNRGSRLFGVRPGDFVVLDANGGMTLRGSLVKDFESLRKALQGN